MVIYWINFLLLLSIVGIFPAANPSNTYSPIQEPLFVLFERADLNKVIKNRSQEESSYSEEYPLDYDRSYIVRNGNAEVTFNYQISYPENSSNKMDFWQVDKAFLKSNDFMDQDWFRETPKSEISQVFSDTSRTIYLVDKKKNRRGKATLIQVYFENLE